MNFYFSNFKDRLNPSGPFSFAASFGNPLTPVPFVRICVPLMFFLDHHVDAVFDDKATMLVDSVSVENKVLRILLTKEGHQCIGLPAVKMPKPSNEKYSIASITLDGDVKRARWCFENTLKEHFKLILHGPLDQLQSLGTVLYTECVRKTVLAPESPIITQDINHLHEFVEWVGLALLDTVPECDGYISQSKPHVKKVHMNLYKPFIKWDFQENVGILVLIESEKRLYRNKYKNPRNFILCDSVLCEELLE